MCVHRVLALGGSKIRDRQCEPGNGLVTAMEEGIREQIRCTVIELSPQSDAVPRPIMKADPETRLVEDLGYHSLALMELAFALEEEFQLPPVDQTAADHIVTVGDVEDYVCEHLSATDDQSVP